MDSDLRNEKIGFKIRQHTLAKVPYLLVVGDREVEEMRLSPSDPGRVKTWVAACRKWEEFAHSWTTSPNRTNSGIWNGGDELRNSDRRIDTSQQVKKRGATKT